MLRGVNLQETSSQDLSTLRPPKTYRNLLDTQFRGKTPRLASGYPDTKITHCSHCNFGFTPDEGIIPDPDQAGRWRHKSPCGPEKFPFPLSLARA
jgi:hypothetical protein